MEMKADKMKMTSLLNTILPKLCGIWGHVAVRNKTAKAFHLSAFENLKNDQMTPNDLISETTVATRTFSMTSDLSPYTQLLTLVLIWNLYVSEFELIIQGEKKKPTRSCVHRGALLRG